MKTLAITMLFVFLSACSTFKAGHVEDPPPPIEAVGVDPTVTWTAVIETCDGALVNPSYNIYIVDGPGPIPSITGDELPCGTLTKVDTSLVSPDNATPIAGTSYHFLRPNGIYTLTLEAVLPGGFRSGKTEDITFEVKDGPLIPTGVIVIP